MLVGAHVLSSPVVAAWGVSALLDLFFSTLCLLSFLAWQACCHAGLPLLPSSYPHGPGDLGRGQLDVPVPVMSVPLQQRLRALRPWPGLAPPRACPRQPGVILQAVRGILHVVREAGGHNCSCSVSMSYLEAYQEKLRGGEQAAGSKGEKDRGCWGGCRGEALSGAGVQAKEAAAPLEHPQSLQESRGLF